jgi:hypothetical protein
MFAAAPASAADLPRGDSDEEDAVAALSCDPRVAAAASAAASAAAVAGLHALPGVVLELLAGSCSLRDASRAACACAALRAAALGAASRRTVLDATSLGEAQPSVGALAYAAAHCPLLAEVHLGAGATDAHLAALAGCARRHLHPASCPIRSRCSVSAAQLRATPS